MGIEKKHKKTWFLLAQLQKKKMLEFNDDGCTVQIEMARYGDYHLIIHISRDNLPAFYIILKMAKGLEVNTTPVKKTCIRLISSDYLYKYCLYHVPPSVNK